jgi:hypothetical protein
VGSIARGLREVRSAREESFIRKFQSCHDTNTTHIAVTTCIEHVPSVWKPHLVQQLREQSAHFKQCANVQGDDATNRNMLRPVAGHEYIVLPLAFKWVREHFYPNGKPNKKQIAAFLLVALWLEKHIKGLPLGLG